MKTFSTRIAVRDYELDSQGIVNNANYLHYLELARHEFCQQARYSFAQMAADGLDPVVRRAELDYIAPLRMGDVMEVELTMTRRGAKFLFNQAIFRAADHSPVLRAVITIACLEGGRISRGDRLAEKFADYLTDSEQ